MEEKDIEESSKSLYGVSIDNIRRFQDENSIPDIWENMNLDTFSKYRQHLIEDGKEPSTVKNINHPDDKIFQ